ncbi:hypothetical protein ILUMI_20512 [Ignelater luminosus]|uniref:Uncharacterized protein n=1 Tax=Ignelater luminosus TaxID=2038154 RepID=A0A8K0G4I0_IGNLU|nr:hypothetical protein ILUMI_20512 [Ignelater luminosus]
MSRHQKVGEKFLKERYEKDSLFFTVYDHYTPNFHRAIVTGKFYNKYDCLDLSQADMDLVDQIKKTKDKLPKQKYDWPVTESHNYGWFDPLVLLDRKDRRFYAPLNISPSTQQEIRIRADKSMQKPKFTGIPFKL